MNTPQPEHAADSDVVSLDLSKPLAVRAAMVRLGMGPGQMRPYESADLGYVNPLDHPSVQADVRTFLAHIWKAALDAEHKAQFSDGECSVSADRVELRQQHEDERGAQAAGAVRDFDLGDRPAPVVDGCVEILVALTNVPPEHRLEAFALAADAAIKTEFLNQCPWEDR